jgi:hypothetical protein
MACTNDFNTSPVCILIRVLIFIISQEVELRAWASRRVHCYNAVNVREGTVQARPTDQAVAFSR